MEFAQEKKILSWYSITNYKYSPWKWQHTKRQWCRKRYITIGRQGVLILHECLYRPTNHTTGWVTKQESLLPEYKSTSKPQGTWIQQVKNNIQSPHCSPYLCTFGVCIGAVWDDLGKAADPVVDLVPSSALHLIMCDSPLLLPGSPRQTLAHHTLTCSRREAARCCVGEHIADDIKLSWKG